MKKGVLVIMTVLACGSVFAEGNDSVSKSVPTSALTTYSWGFGAGAFRVVDREFQNPDNQVFLKMAFENTIYLRKNLDAFIDADWFIPGGNLGADAGLDFIFNRSDFRPFFGAGVGAHYWDKSKSFADGFGPSGTIHAGASIDLSRSLQLRIRVPFQFTWDKAGDKVLGLEIGFLISRPWRHIEKLDYDKL